MNRNKRLFWPLFWMTVGLALTVTLLLGLAVLVSGTVAAAPLCHPDITRADCAGADIDIVGSGSYTLKVWVDGGWLDEVDAPGDSTVTLDWSDYPSIDVCQQHTLYVEMWSSYEHGSDDATFGGPECCPPSVTVDKALVEPVGRTAVVSETVVFNIIITNTGSSTITHLPLQDVYDPVKLDYLGAVPASDDNDDDGVIDWSDLTASFGSDLAPGQAFTVEVSFHAAQATTILSAQAAAHGLESLLTPQTDPVVDGLLDNSYVYLQHFSKSGSGNTALAPGNLYGYEGADTCYWAFVVDRAFNDNVYADYHLDDPYMQQDGWDKHEFGQLEESDKAVFNVGSFTGLTLDYLRDVGGGWDSGQTGNDDSAAPGTPPISAAMTSLHWNLENSGWDGGTWGDPLKHSPPYTTTLPWEWHMIYEFSIPKSQMNGECGDVDQAGAHNSPNKDDESKGKIGDRVWEDNNSDGNQDAGEDGLPGVTVDLYQGSMKIRTTETEPGVSGYYIFNNLEAGTYRVDVDESTLPPDYVLTSNNEPMTVTIAAGEVFTDADFGYYLQGTASIGDRVFYDQNEDGLPDDDGEPGINGVTVKLYSGTCPPSGGPIQTQVTSGNGDYDFTNLVAGTYCVDVDESTLPAGLSLTTGNEPHEVTVADGDDYNDADFGYWSPSPCVGGTRDVAMVSGAEDQYGRLPPDVWGDACVEIVAGDARISISPGSDTNDVGDSHTFVIHTEKKPGGSWVDAAGVVVTVTFPGGAPGTVDFSDCDAGTDANGECEVVINSSAAGGFSAHAAADIEVVSGFILHRETDGTGGNSGDAAKTYVDAKIELDPLQATNKVGDEHIIMATVQVHDGTGWGPAPDSTTVTFSLENNSAGAFFVGGINTCLTSGGSCSVTINANGAGSVDIHAQTDVSVGGLVLHRETGVSAGSSGDAAKTYVDAKIELDPLNAANQVGDEHVITAYVDVHDGTGWGPAPDGATVTFSLQNNTAGAYFVGGINTCLTSGGSCSVTINGNASGSVDIHAQTDVSVGGLVVHRETDGTGSNSGDAQKIYVVMDYEISKTLNGPDAVGVGHAVSFTIRIINTGDTTITVLPLSDVYSSTYLTYGYTNTVTTWADPDSDDHNDDGEINWSDLTLAQGDLAPSASFTVIVTFTAKADTTLLQPDSKTENTAIVDGAKADPDGGGPLPEEELPQKQDSDRVQIVVPTGVVLGSLNAVAQPDGVLVSWQTANEVRILGFNLLRRGVGGELEQVDKEFIFAEYAGADQGSDYACLDKGVVSGRTYDYVLEAIMSDGRVEQYDVPAVTARWWLQLPLLLAR